MDLRTAAILAGLAAACLPAAAAEPAAPTPPARQTRVAALPTAAAPADRTGSVAHRRVGRSIQRHKNAEAAPTTAGGTPLAAPPSFSSDAVGWHLIEDPATGARFGVPEKLVPVSGASPTGSRWSSAQGQIQIESFRLSEAALPALFEQEKRTSKRQVASSALKADSFVITGTQGLKNFVLRAQARGAEIRGISILYDQATAGVMDRIAAAVASSFAGFPDPNEAPAPGLKRAVDYGSAIVVGSGGDLVASAQLTADCAAITVPPLGHAERIAADAGSGLALIRVYGARNLVAAPLGDDAAEPGDLTLVGVADPLAQAGAGETTTTAARVTPQGLEPAPKIGFAGAAAVDARGRLVGMVDLRAAIVAGGGATAQAATLVSAPAIRSFLQAQGVTPAAASGDAAAIRQSVMRVICVHR